ncbi:hypothetical protein HDU67_003517 [Dinochytrium kinnereticum]|nr:hypothetical protein HDU67_003517 [Dinochytrium kinnereticum]
MIGTSQETVTAVQKKSQEIALAEQNHRKYMSPPKHRIKKDAADSFFMKVQVLDGFEDAGKARRLLERLRDDVGVREIMRKRNWVVGVLMELHPNEKTILGYNMNKGQTIALRLRTDELDGFRHYPSIRQVLLHELAHMIHTGHGNDFHALNRLLNKECNSYSEGHTVGQSSFASSSEDADAIDAHGYTGGSYVLGGKKRPEDVPLREVLAEAALLRLSMEEEEIMKGCGSQKSPS